jgi:flagellar M-ring protein FliF
VLTLKSMTFSPVPSLGTGAEAIASAGAVDVSGLVKMALAAAVAIALAAFVVRPALMSRARPALPAADPLQIAGSGQAGWEDSPAAPRVVTGEIEDAADGTRSGLVDVEATELPNDPVERLRRMIDQRQAESLEILRGWLDRGEETA